MTGITKSENINEISTALAKAQGQLESAKKGEQGYGYRYSDLSTVIDTAKDVLSKNGLAVVQLIGEQSEKNVSLTTILTHSSGQFFQSVASLPVIEMKGCNPAQCAGATLSYLRRYAYQAIIGMASEDSDASSNGLEKPAKTTSFKAAETKVEAKSEAVIATVDAAPVQRQRFKKGAANGSNELDL
jgi:hypothetical protein